MGIWELGFRNLPVREFDVVGSPVPEVHEVHKVHAVHTKYTNWDLGFRI